MNRIHNHACHNELFPPLSIIIPWIRLRKRLLSEEKGDGRGRIIPVRGINLLFRDTHSNAAVRDLKSGCSSAPFHGCVTLFATANLSPSFPTL